MGRHKRTDYHVGYFMPSYTLHIAQSGSMHLVEQDSGKKSKQKQIGVAHAKEDVHGGFLIWLAGGLGCIYVMDDEIKRERDTCIS